MQSTACTAICTRMNLKYYGIKTYMDQNSGTAKCQQHFKGNIIWSAEFNVIRNDSHCIISEPSHT